MNLSKSTDKQQDLDTMEGKLAILRQLPLF
jgi:hypothetical protein